ncbi:hypothetical protein PM082_016641 [Marasmius tenuissimus]|nr:hypothetical protein PM082_016641 [Marasmius tenuissimus]
MTSDLSLAPAHINNMDEVATFERTKLKRPHSPDSSAHHKRIRGIPDGEKRLGTGYESSEAEVDAVSADEDEIEGDKTITCRHILIFL